jgi:hypothetical protein
MRPKQNFQKRSGKKHDTSMMMRSRQKITNVKRQRGKYPVLAEKIVEMSDIILEVLDSRFIGETRNPEIEAVIKKRDKEIVYVFNKSDLIDASKKSSEYLDKLSPHVFVSCFKKEGIRNLRDLIKIMAKRVESPVDKVLDKVTVGIIGYPNTGKSSLINLLAGRTATGVGANPGFTKGIIKIRLTPKIMLLDSPGIISEGDYSTSYAYAMSKHTKLGARSYSTVREPSIAVYNLMKEYRDVLEKFYGIEANGDAEILIEELGKRRNFRSTGGQVDEDRTSRLILKDWQEGRIRL